jgi:hypothetical protein
MTDKAGRPKIEHLIRVVERLRADGRRLGAFNDVLEDTPLVAEDLIASGCPAAVGDAVAALARS